MSKRLKDHVAKLARSLHCRIVECAKREESEAVADPYGRNASIYVPVYKTPNDYFTALHELGHIHFNQQLKRFGYMQHETILWLHALLERLKFNHDDPDSFEQFHTIVKEMAAWQWAINVALLSPNSSVRDMIRACVRGYWPSFSKPPARFDPMFVKLFKRSNSDVQDQQ